MDMTEGFPSDIVVGFVIAVFDGLNDSAQVTIYLVTFEVVREDTYGKPGTGKANSNPKHRDCTVGVNISGLRLSVLVNHRYVPTITV